MQLKRGQIWWADLGTGIGCEQSGERPVLILQNDVGNEYSPTTIIAPITDGKKRYLPTHAKILNQVPGIKKESVVLLEQIRTIDKDRLINGIGSLSKKNLELVDRCTAVSLGLTEVKTKKAAPVRAVSK